MDCSRINLIVGKPNVGKSNILEALSLFCAPYSKNSEKFLSEFIRYNEVQDIFFDSEIYNPIVVKTNIVNADISLGRGIFQMVISLSENIISEITFDVSGKRLSPLPESPATKEIKKYLFKPPVFDDLNGSALLPPFGENLFSTILTHSKLRKEIGEWLKEYRLDLVLDKRNKSISVQKREGNVVYPIAYNLIADTLQRIIFHYAAIESNKDAVLLFEEPESHSFPPYIYELANKIIDDENNNQYFITTHSPHLFNTIVERTERKDLSVFIANYKEYQTVVKKLSTDDLSELLDYGIDIFFNQKYFLDEKRSEYFA